MYLPIVAPGFAWWVPLAPEFVLPHFVPHVMALFVAVIFTLVKMSERQWLSKLLATLARITIGCHRLNCLSNNPFFLPMQVSSSISKLL